jgi:hypothetical protein
MNLGVATKIRVVSLGWLAVFALLKHVNHFRHGSPRNLTRFSRSTKSFATPNESFLPELQIRQMEARVPELHCHSLRRLPERKNAFLCAHPDVHARGQEVDAAVCQDCAFRTRPPPSRFRALATRSSRLHDRGEVQLVVARYRESLAWLQPFQSFPTIIYDKGELAAENHLPNVGRESHTYLHHIIANYDRLAEITVFLQGNPLSHVPDLPNKLWSLEREVGYRDLSDEILVEDKHGHPVHPGLRMDEMHRGLFGTPGPDHYLCHPSACFAVSRERIRQHPLSFYQRAQALVLRRAFGPWEIERLWQFIFAAAAATEGVVTASDAAYFRDLQLLVHSHRQRGRFPMTVFDLGMDPRQRDWCYENDVAVAALPRVYKPVERIRELSWWHTWLKPFYLFHAPYDRVLWLDADCVILGDLSEAFRRIQEQPLLVRDGTPAETRNHPLLYHYLPVPHGCAIDGACVNAGVVGLNKLRDRALLNAWGYGVAWMALNPDKQRLSAWADQGMLLWALQYTGRTNCIDSHLGWNYPSGPVSRLLATSMTNGRSVLQEIGSRFPAARIVHWFGVHKLSQQLTSELEELFVNGARCEFATSKLEDLPCRAE